MKKISCTFVVRETEQTLLYADWQGTNLHDYMSRVPFGLFDFLTVRLNCKHMKQMLYSRLRFLPYVVFVLLCFAVPDAVHSANATHGEGVVLGRAIAAAEGGGGLVASGTGGQQSRPNVSSSPDGYALAVAAIEKEYDLNLYQVLSLFFAPGSFFSDVRIELQPAPKSRQQGLSAPRATSDGRQAISLPGLPFFPGEAATPLSATGSSSLQVPGGFHLKRLLIFLVADSRYSEGELAFMKQLTEAAAKVDPRRGDEIIISTQVFPSETVTTTLSEEVTETITARKRPVLTMRRPLDIPGTALIISSALLIFVVIYLAVVLHRHYSQKANTGQ